MGHVKRFRCNNCGERFEQEVLSSDERREAELEGRPLSAIHCPKCRRTDIRDGWE